MQAGAPAGRGLEPGGEAGEAVDPGGDGSFGGVRADEGLGGPPGCPGRDGRAGGGLARGGGFARVKCVVIKYDVQLNKWLNEWCSPLSIR